MTKYTPGPWEANEKGYVQKFPEEPMKTITLCTVYGGGGESKANAKLIAAAPDLLEALQGLMKEVEKMCPMSSDKNYYDMLMKWQEGFQAIKKASL